MSGFRPGCVRSLCEFALRALCAREDMSQRDDRLRMVESARETETVLVLVTPRPRAPDTAHHTYSGGQRLLDFYFRKA
jgi:hypothetical protein